MASLNRMIRVGGKGEEGKGRTARNVPFSTASGSGTSMTQKLVMTCVKALSGKPVF